MGLSIPQLCWSIMRLDLFDSSSPIRCLGFLSSRKSAGHRKHADPFPSPSRTSRHRAETSASLFSFSTNSDDLDVNSTITRDSEYYLNDRDAQGQKLCVLRVKNKLFKVKQLH